MIFLLMTLNLKIKNLLITEDSNILVKKVYFSFTTSLFLCNSDVC